MAMDTTYNIHMDIREGRIYIRIGNMDRMEGGLRSSFACGSFFVLSWEERVESCITNQNRGKGKKINNREKDTPRNTLASRLQFQLQLLHPAGSD